MLFRANVHILASIWPRVSSSVIKQSVLFMMQALISKQARASTDPFLMVSKHSKLNALMDKSELLSPNRIGRDILNTKNQARTTSTKMKELSSLGQEWLPYQLPRPYAKPTIKATSTSSPKKAIYPTTEPCSLNIQTLNTLLPPSETNSLSRTTVLSL